MPRKVAVLGWSGHGNLGDEAILAGFKTLFNGWDIHVVDDRYFPNLNFNDINSCDLFVLGGGELIGSEALYSKTGIFPVSWLKKIHTRKAILGCGVNASSARELSRFVKKDLDRFNYIGVRDYGSLNILSRDYEAEFFPDLSFALHAKPGRCRRDTTVVVPTDRHTRRYDKGIRMLNLVPQAREWLSSQLRDSGNVVYVPFGSTDNDDLSTCKELCQNPEHKIAAGMSVDEVLNLMRRADRVIAFRLHGLILGEVAGAKVLIYPYHNKLLRAYEVALSHTVEELRSIQHKRLKVMMEKCEVC